MPALSAKDGRREMFMTKEELASILNGREYTKEITKEEAQQAKENGLVVVFGASDDLIEFLGAIDDEVSCYEGGLIAISKEGLPRNECDDDECPYFAKLLEGMLKIKVLWDKDGYCWKYETPFPVAEFDIFEDGEKYCRGIVFDINSIEKQSDNKALHQNCR